MRNLRSIGSLIVLIFIFLVSNLICLEVFEVDAKPIGVIERGDGSISVVHPCRGSKKKEETEEAWLERVFSKAAGEDTYVIMDSKDLPKDRKDRNEWELKDKKISVNLIKKAEKAAKKKAKEDKRVLLLEKIGLTEEEFKELQGVL